jgi:hypothetical protein
MSAAQISKALQAAIRRGLIVRRPDGRFVLVRRARRQDGKS